jgi:hypothetical protein
MNPRHPFTGESEHNVAILEFGCHCNHETISHPKECHPRIRGRWTWQSKRLTRREKGGKFEDVSRDFVSVASYPIERRKDSGPDPAKCLLRKCVSQLSLIS